MALPTPTQYGATPSPVHPQANANVISTTDDDEVYNEDPQIHGAPPAHQGQTLPFNQMPGDFVWNSPQAGGAIANTPIHGTPAYNGTGGMHSYPDVATNTGPYMVQHTYPSPPMAYHTMQPPTPFGTPMDAGTDDAGHPSHPPMQYMPPPQQANPMLQVNQTFFTPGQSPMVAPGLEPNNQQEPFMDQPPPKRLRIQGPVDTPAAAQGTSEPDTTNPNSWTEAQDNLVRHLKDEKKKVNQIATSLKDKFGVVRSANAISKRWKVIKKRSSRVGSKDLIQNVMTSSLRLLNEQVAQLVRIKDEAERDFKKGYETLLEEYMFKLQRGRQSAAHAAAQGGQAGQAGAGAQGQVLGLGLGQGLGMRMRHGGVNL
ncbi:hypothetical protein B0T20DRAFT_457162 [Sordaria brevicollis]|uniref:Myb-like domain-containing protein n=1 Tax=Sordaria brevicollis TaxID=83679 RepID=A0AAE0NVS0_SORBR|nr:hypothetical protein B0T20DRAFT_457162 [Sordaria brevicollis]